MIKLRRLQEVPVKGNFTIHCENHEQFVKLQNLFLTGIDYTIFKKVPKIYEISTDAIYAYRSAHANDASLPLDKKTKFIIKYESLAELLKLRDIFRIRGAKFDVYLLAKRKMGEFDTFFSENFLKEFLNLNISKIRK